MEVEARPAIGQCVKSAVRMTTIGNTGCGMLALIWVRLDSLVSIWQEVAESTSLDQALDMLRILESSGDRTKQRPK